MMTSLIAALWLGLAAMGATSSKSDALSTKISAMIAMAIADHNSAETYSDWAESQFNPGNLAIKLRELEHQKGFAKAFCRSISHLDRRDYYYLADYLDAVGERTDCIGLARDAYTEFLSTSRSQLLFKYMKEEARPTAIAKGVEILQDLPPSQVVTVDAKSTPTLIDGGLPTKVIALTFDDGPHPTRTPELLQLLKRENIQVNFFLVGSNTTLYPDIVRQEKSDGHEVGCHSFTHPDLRKLPFDKAVKEIEDGFTAIKNALGVPGSMFRFPYGAYTNDLRNYLISKNTPEFFWNIDTLDWKYKDPNFLIDYALGEIRKEGHGIVLFHDIQPQTLAIMPGLISALRNEGYRFAMFKPKDARLSPVP